MKNKTNNTYIYDCWAGMMKRCYNPDNKDYKYYGAKGINVCSEWHVYHNFKSWALASGWEIGLTIDRTDNSKGYHPENCRWATRTQQSRNRPGYCTCTLEKARIIRILYAQGGTSYRKLAKAFNIDHTIVGDIIRGELWKDE